ncbi:hypothetical protein A3B18_00630 [Candidatus Giovannonibacteria bacterium RIFCSPLOWO2_01_FULL_46_13]|uniref:Uncharacterized protein n=1 Tax=Candidatus Giovannonibacteria bacterium RIFCSPLOWO2_01_FULL_46_13 TaxID=1798352 RepID=A0A1F5X3P7_9BACT|nr:MAG: hypothetical protein A3B18_00630 [Candidatus Giovannonibacteria bacterium RIFCSPLOWO2_01_FULL_46_13]
MVVFPLILGISLVGIFFLTHRYLREAKTFSTAELRLKMSLLTSVRSDIKTRFVAPAISKAKEASVPVALHAFDKLVNLVRVWVLKLERYLRLLSDNIRGTAINLDVAEKSEYWQNLGVAKSGGSSPVLPKKIIVK